MLSLKEYKEIIDLNYRPRPAAELTEEEKSVICDEMLGVQLRPQRAAGELVDVALEKHGQPTALVSAFDAHMSSKRILHHPETRILRAFAAFLPSGAQIVNKFSQNPSQKS